MASNVIKYINNALLLDGMKKEMALASVLAKACIRPCRVVYPEDNVHFCGNCCSGIPQGKIKPWYDSRRDSASRWQFHLPAIMDTGFCMGHRPHLGPDCHSVLGS